LLKVELTSNEALPTTCFGSCNELLTSFMLLGKTTKRKRKQIIKKSKQEAASGMESMQQKVGEA